MPKTQFKPAKRFVQVPLTTLHKANEIEMLNRTRQRNTTFQVFLQLPL